MSDSQSDARDPSVDDADDADDGVLIVRRGPGANCSSIGSAVEMLFLSATVGAAVLAAVVAALRPSPVETPASKPSDEGSTPA